MKRIFIITFSMLISACNHVAEPVGFESVEVQNSTFKIAIWKKDSHNKSTVKIYIEGDGYAFDIRGQPTNNPTPRDTFMQNLAFNDYNENVVYMARPCQFTNDEKCETKYWGKARFSKEVVDSMAMAVKSQAMDREIIFIGYSGGAQVAGLVAVLHPEIKVKKIITIAGNLDHPKWAEYHHVPALDESFDLSDYKEKFVKIPSIHYAGKKDEIVPPFLIEGFAGKNNVIIVPNATHNKGWDSISEEVWNED